MNLQPLMAQGLMGYTAYVSGLAQASRGLGLLVLTPLVGLLIGKVDNRLLIGPGMLLIAVAALMMGNFNLDISSHDFFWPNFIQGMGMALTMVPLMTVALATISNRTNGQRHRALRAGAQPGRQHRHRRGDCDAIARRAAASSLSRVASDALRSALSKCGANGAGRV